jgi:hypothetical protein
VLVASPVQGHTPFFAAMFAAMCRFATCDNLLKTRDETPPYSPYGQMLLDPVHATGMSKPLRICILPLASVKITDGTSWPVAVPF